MTTSSVRAPSRHVVLVGVAAVGKTTLGRRAAALCNLPFADTDETMERACGVTIDALSRDPRGDARLDALLWVTYQALLGRETRTLIAATPRLLGRRDLWRLTRAKAHSIHLRAAPLAVLRRDVAAREGIPVADVRLTEAEKAAFYRYYWWRLRHCQHADRELRLDGQLEADARRLAALVGATDRPLSGLGEAKPAPHGPGVL